MALPPPSPDSVERFRADLEKVIGTVPARLGVAVSGGPDSLALLLLANSGYPGSIEAATVDHGLRPASGAEAQSVAAACADLAVPHRILRPDWTEPPAANLQAAAREVRYAALGAWALDRDIEWIATAHHLDDQAETLLMRLARGSGIAGLSGIRAASLLGSQGLPVWIVRPLLGWRRQELADLVVESGLSAADDPSNRDERFDRTRARELLGATPWLAPERLAAAAGNLAEADLALVWMANRLFAAKARPGDGTFTVDAADLPAELQRRLVRDVIGRLGGEEPPGPKLAALLDSLRAGGTATLAGVKCVGGATWRFEPAPPRRSG